MAGVEQVSTNPITDLVKGMGELFSNAKPSWGNVLKVFLIVLFVILVAGAAVGIWLLSKQKTPDSNIVVTESERKDMINSGENIKKGKEKEKEGFANPFNAPNSLYGSLIQNLDERERFLINLQPLTANVGGYIGPLEKGVFSSDFYVQNALRAGIRAFILPISTYLDDNKTPPYWPNSGKPAIVFRDKNGTIQSLNGLSVKKFCESLMTYKNENPSQVEEPIIITLAAVPGYVPDPVKMEKEYVMLMRDIAQELKPLESSRLITYGQYGSVVGGQREKEILTAIPLADLKNKVLIATTFDTRLGLKDRYVNMRPSLHEYSNFILQPMLNDPGQMTNQPNVLEGASTGNSSKYLRLSDVVGSKVNYVDLTRTVWHQTLLDDPSIMPTAADISAANKAGIQSIPIPFFYFDSEEVMNIWKLWGGFAWRLKEKDARFVKPAPIVPAAPSQAMNARVSPDLQPGQTQIR